MGFLFSANVYAFILMVLFLWLKTVKIGFLFSVNVYTFISMVLFLWLKIVKMGFYLVLMYMHVFLWCFFYG